MTASTGETPDRAVLLSSRAVVPQVVVHRSFVQETVLLNLETGLYHGLNPTGGKMFDALAQGGSIGEVAVKLSAEFGGPLDEIRRDLCEFCTDLEARGLIVIEPFE